MYSEKNFSYPYKWVALRVIRRDTHFLGGKSPPVVGGFFSGGNFSGGTENVFNLVPPNGGDFSADQKSTFLCKIFACGALLDSVFSKFSPVAGFNDLFFTIFFHSKSILRSLSKKI